MNTKAPDLARLFRFPTIHHLVFMGPGSPLRSGRDDTAGLD